MSVRLRTSENTMIRVPNETLIKSSIINLSHYADRCLLIPVGIGYTADNQSGQNPPAGFIEFPPTLPEKSCACDSF